MDIPLCLGTRMMRTVHGDHGQSVLQRKETAPTLILTAFSCPTVIGLIGPSKGNGICEMPAASLYMGMTFSSMVKVQYVGVAIQ
jgi:hypothetical protein